LSATCHSFNLPAEAVAVIDNHHQEKIRNNDRAGDRRLKCRFRIEQDVRYKMLCGQRVAETGAGKTTNISSGGVCFTTASMLSIGIPVELSMNWPVLLNQSCPLKLMMYGCVVRSTDKGSAVVIERYEFRTQGKGARRVEGMELGV
jgi:hypothetical protein